MGHTQQSEGRWVIVRRKAHRGDAFRAMTPFAAPCTPAAGYCNGSQLQGQVAPCWCYKRADGAVVATARLAGGGEAEGAAGECAAHLMRGAQAGKSDRVSSFRITAQGGSRGPKPSTASL